MLELLVAIAIIGAVAAIVVPNIRTRGGAAQRQEFIAQINALTKFAWQNAVVSHKIQRVEFDFEKRKIEVTQATGEKDMAGERLFGPVARAYIKTSVIIPSHFECKNFFVEGFDEMGRRTATSTAAVWFYVVPEGLAQSVIINILDIKDRPKTGKAYEVSLVLNPFSAQFEVYDAFTQP